MIQFDKHIFQMGGSTTNIAIICFEMVPAQIHAKKGIFLIFLHFPGWFVWDPMKTNEYPLKTDGWFSWSLSL